MGFPTAPWPRHPGRQAQEPAGHRCLVSASALRMPACAANRLLTMQLAAHRPHLHPRLWQTAREGGKKKKGAGWLAGWLVARLSFSLSKAKRRIRDKEPPSPSAVCACAPRSSMALSITHSRCHGSRVLFGYSVRIETAALPSDQRAPCVPWNRQMQYCRHSTPRVRLKGTRWRRD